MDEQKLLDLFVEKGILAPEKRSYVLRDAELAEKDVELMLYESRMVDDIEAAKIKAEYFDIPFKEVNPAEVPDDVLQYVPAEVARNYYFIPIKKTNDTLIVGMLRPKDAKAQEALRFIGQQNKLNLGVYVISYSNFQHLYQKYSPFKSEIDEAMNAIREQAE